MSVREALARLGEFRADERSWQAAIAGHADLARTLAEEER